MKQAYIIAGPNGSGKTTFARDFIEEAGLPFVNADDIAYKLAPDGKFEHVRIKAGKLFFHELNRNIQRGESFAVETTLAGKYFLRVIRKLRNRKYKIILSFIFVENTQEAIDRIKLRVSKGGHDIPEEDVRRRYGRSKKNFWNIYKGLVDEWNLFLSGEHTFTLVAFGDKGDYNIADEDAFARFGPEFEGYE